MESELIVSFVDQSPSYTYGFEAGMIWTKLECNAPHIEATIHRTNVEMIKKLCNIAGYFFDIKGYKDTEYAYVFAIKKTLSNN